ncbi:hypothetical protein SP41_127 [Salmonella phage 41]|nr:hypothetical protein SP41_127 [Salmonella phage 41]
MTVLYNVDKVQSDPTQVHQMITKCLLKVIVEMCQYCLSLIGYVVRDPNYPFSLHALKIKSLRAIWRRQFVMRGGEYSKLDLIWDNPQLLTQSLSQY